MEEEHAWQYTWEALSHVKSLRLFLMNPQNPVSTMQCNGLTASLLPSHGSGVSKLLIKWNVKNKMVWMEVPVPPLVIDHSFPVHAMAMSDHIQVKLMLLLPIDHPFNTSFSSLLLSGNQQPSEKMLLLENDIQGLESKGEVHLYCKNCSKQITAFPMRSFKDQPSMNWREVADNWFGSCCCSFGGISQSMVTKFEKLSKLCRGTCFVGTASISVHVDDIARNSVIIKEQHASPSIEEFINSRRDKEEVKIDTEIKSTDGDMTKNSMLVTNNREKPENSTGYVSSNLLCNKFGNLELQRKNINGIHVNSGSFATEPIDIEDFVSKLPKVISVKEITPCDTQSADSSSNLQLVDKQLLMASQMDSKEATNNATDSYKLTECSHSKLSKSKIDSKIDCCVNGPGAIIPEYQQNIFVLQNGFMMGPSDISDAAEWAPLCCSSCFSLLGSFPYVKGKLLLPFESSLHLFKCHISTSKDGGTEDIFRQNTLQRDFVNQLQACADDDCSYRTVIRDLKTRDPMLQLVLLNSNVWFYTGECSKKVHDIGDGCNGIKNIIDMTSKGGFHNNGQAPKTNYYNLLPAIKVMFSKCCSSSPALVRAVNDWTSKRHAEDIYMLEDEVNTLSEQLSAKNLKLPASYSSFEGFSISFLEK